MSKIPQHDTLVDTASACETMSSFDDLPVLSEDKALTEIENDLGMSRQDFYRVFSDEDSTERIILILREIVIRLRVLGLLDDPDS